MTIALQLEPVRGRPPAVEYRWDADTDILSARLRLPSSAEARTVEVAGTDGSWLMLDVDAERLRGVEVAVWPEVRTSTALQPPTPVMVADARLRSAECREGARTAPMRAEADQGARTVHLRVGSAPVAVAVRLGGDLLLEVDARSRLAGLWLLNVPPLSANA